MPAMDRRPDTSAPKPLEKLRKSLARAVDRARTGLRIHATAFVAVNSMLNILNLIILRGRFWWAFFPLAGWGAGLCIHAQAALNRVRRKRKIASLEHANPEQLSLIGRTLRSEGAYRIHRMAYVTAQP